MQAFAFGARREVGGQKLHGRFCFSFNCGKWAKVGQTMQKWEKKIKGRPASRKQDAVQCACKSCGKRNKDIIIAVVADL